MLFGTSAQTLDSLAFAAAAKAGTTGKVVAVEPDPWLGMLLRQSAEGFASDAAPVEVLQVAVFDRLGIVEFNVAKRGRASNFVSGFGATQSGGSRESFPVVAVTLDWLAEHFPLPAVIKIDVEGMEHLVMRGGRNILRARPILISEVDRRITDDVSKLLIGHGYNLLDIDLNPATGHLDNIVAIAG